MTNIVLETKNLTKTYVDAGREVEVLKHLDFAIARGEKVAIIGPSGAGKSTLLHLLGGLDAPSSGEVKVNGQALNTLSEQQRSKLRNQSLGFVYQFHHLLPEFTALENVAMPLLIGGATAAKAKAQAQTLLTQVGLADRLTHKLSQLSGGERQRAAIARALVANPACLLADEPTGNLDQETAKQVYELLFKLNKSHETSLLVVTHDLHLASFMDRVLVLEEGRLHPVTVAPATHNQVTPQKLNRDIA